jgi:hypothetical protein
LPQAQQQRQYQAHRAAWFQQRRLSLAQNSAFSAPPAGVVRVAVAEKKRPSQLLSKEQQGPAIGRRARAH